MPANRERLLPWRQSSKYSALSNAGVIRVSFLFKPAVIRYLPKLIPEALALSCSSAFSLGVALRSIRATLDSFLRQEFRFGSVIAYKDWTETSGEIISSK